MQIALRPALAMDFDYCARLYFSGMDRVIRELNLDQAAQVTGLRHQWDPAQVRIITLDGADVGWLHVIDQGDALFLAQLFVDGPCQGRGIGTEVVNSLIGEAARAHKAVTLGVVKSNPALRLYTRIGFRITDEDDRKFYMRRDFDTGA
jgi:ribosomal protein S18 acetylase RimI-like enzyme